jgi:hypothetical protein
VSYKSFATPPDFGVIRPSTPVSPMQPSDFIALPAQQQLDTLYYAGNVMANRYEDENIYLLYNIDTFYVELRYDAANNALRQVSAFKSTEQLEPYLPYLNETF